MTAHFYVKEQTLENPREFDVALLWHMEKHAKGEIFSDLKNTKIIYDRESGEVNLVGINTSPDVQNIYSATDFQNFTNPIKNAVACLAKLELLRHLSKLGDNQIAIILHQTEAHCATAKSVTDIQFVVENALLKIFNYSKPVEAKKFLGTRLFSAAAVTPSQRSQLQEAVHAALTQQTEITCKNHVVACLAIINARVTNTITTKI